VAKINALKSKPGLPRSGNKNIHRGNRGLEAGTVSKQTVGGRKFGLRGRRNKIENRPNVQENTQERTAVASG
jgi:hypothetical protein